jgi:hypothetical protein
MIWVKWEVQHLNKLKYRMVHRVDVNTDFFWALENENKME